MIKLLIADDAASQLAAYRMIFDHPDIELVEADGLSSARAAIEAHQLNGAIVDIMFSDTDGDGLQVIKILAAAQPSCAILAVTARRRNVDESLLPTLGADKYLAKAEATPARLRELMNEVMLAKGGPALPEFPTN